MRKLPSYSGLASKVEIEIHDVESLHTLVACSMIVSETRCRQNPALYHRFKYLFCGLNDILIQSILSRGDDELCATETSLCFQHSLRVLIVFISNASDANCVEPETVYLTLSLLNEYSMKREDEICGLEG